MEPLNISDLSSSYFCDDVILDISDDKKLQVDVTTGRLCATSLPLWRRFFYELGSLFNFEQRRKNHFIIAAYLEQIDNLLGSEDLSAAILVKLKNRVMPGKHLTIRDLRQIEKDFFIPTARQEAISALTLYRNIKFITSSGKAPDVSQELTYAEKALDLAKAHLSPHLNAKTLCELEDLSQQIATSLYEHSITEQAKKIETIISHHSIDLEKKANQKELSSEEVKSPMDTLELDPKILGMAESYLSTSQQFMHKCLIFLMSPTMHEIIALVNNLETNPDNISKILEPENRALLQTYMRNQMDFFKNCQIHLGWKSLGDSSGTDVLLPALIAILNQEDLMSTGEKEKTLKRLQDLDSAIRIVNEYYSKIRDSENLLSQAANKAHMTPKNFLHCAKYLEYIFGDLQGQKYFNHTNLLVGASCSDKALVASPLISIQQNKTYEVQEIHKG